MTFAGAFFSAAVFLSGATPKSCGLLMGPSGSSVTLSSLQRHQVPTPSWRTWATARTRKFSTSSLHVAPNEAAGVVRAVVAVGGAGALVDEDGSQLVLAAAGAADVLPQVQALREGHLVRHLDLGQLLQVQQGWSGHVRDR